jgi:HAD superfamily phosphatase (TIGR01668 family)
VIAPDLYLKSLACLSQRKLDAMGIRYVLLDIDNTIVARDSDSVAPEAKAWIETVRQRGIRVCLLSNNWHRVVLRYAAQLELPIVWRAIKPLPFAFLAAQHRIGARARQTLVVGDQLMTDVVGGKLLGMRTALLSPLSEHDLWHTLLLRQLERRLLGSVRPDAAVDRDGAFFAANGVGATCEEGANRAADQDDA